MKLRGVLFKLGIFTVATLAVTVVLASQIGNFALLRSRYQIRAAFNDATGVSPGDPVTLAGVKVGKVDGANVDHGIAIVKLAIDKSVKLPTSTHIEIRYRNLLGLRVVNLDPGAGTGPYLSPGDLVPTTQTEGPLDLDTIFNNLKPLLTGINPSDINALSEALVQAIAPHKADIDQVLSDTSKLLGTLSTKDAQIGSLIDNLGTVSTAVADQRVQLEQLLSNLATLADSLSADSGQLDRVLVNLNTATGELAHLVKTNRTSLERDIGNIAKLLELVRKHQADLAEILQKLDDVQRATLKAMSYGEWVNIYIPALCLAGTPGCENATSSSSASGSLPDLTSILSSLSGGNQ
ncbi:MAG TPA: MlaD family protein [Actinomycetota bacterium]|nr:MlaD family protein [Actinomycetota bacterium]